MNDQQIEQEIQAKGLTAPRVTPADIEANIASEHYFTAADGHRFGWLTEDHANSEMRDQVESISGSIRTSGKGSISADIDANAGTPVSLALLTFCVLVLRNGFTVTGESACASPENFDADLGKKIARAAAVNKVWPLMGYALKDRLAGPSDGQVNRFLQWPVPAHVYPDGAPGQPGRTGTNLLDATTAKAMLTHVLGG